MRPPGDKWTDRDRAAFEHEFSKLLQWGYAWGRKNLWARRALGWEYHWDADRLGVSREVGIALGQG